MPGVEAEGEDSLLLIGLSRDLMDCWGRQHKPQGGRLATLGTPGTLARLGTRPGYTTHHGAHGWGLVLTMYWGQHGELIKFREKGTLIDNKSFLSELFAINYRLETDDKVVTFLQYKQPWLVLYRTVWFRPANIVYNQHIHHQGERPQWRNTIKLGKVFIPNLCRCNSMNQKYFLFMSGEPNGLFISKNISS